MAAIGTAGWLLLRFRARASAAMRSGWRLGSTSLSPSSLFAVFLPDAGSPSPSASLPRECWRLSYYSRVCVGPEAEARRTGVGEGKATRDESSARAAGMAGAAGRSISCRRGGRRLRVASLSVMSRAVVECVVWGRSRLAVFPHSACRVTVWTGAELAPARANESFLEASERMNVPTEPTSGALQVSSSDV